MENLKNKAGCCGSIHGKTFEIFLIIDFLLGAAVLIVNLILTKWYLQQSHYVFFIEIGLISLNGLCLIFTIILRCWRSDGSVLNSNYSSSRCLAIFIIIFVIINFLGSLCEEALFYFIYYVITPRDNKSDETYLKIIGFFSDIMNNIDKDEDDENHTKTEFNILKILPWVSFSFNAFIQILGIIFISLIIKRINNKSDYGISADALTINGSSVKLGNSSGINVVNLGNNNGNIEEKEKEKVEKKIEKFDKDDIFPNPESDKREILKVSDNTKKKKKKVKIKKNKKNNKRK